MSDRGRSTPFVLGLVVLIAVGVGLRLGFLATAARPLPNPGDAVAYHLLGAGLASGEGYVRPFDRIAGRTIPTAEWAPAFPALLAVADRAGVDTIDQQRRLASGLAAIGIGLTGLAGRRAAGAAAGLVSSAVIALHPLLVQNDTALLTEGLACAAGAAVLLASLRAAESASLRAAVALGASVGAAALVRADALVLLPMLLVPLGLVIGFGRSDRRRAARLVAVSVGCAALVVTPWVARNGVRLGRAVGVSTNAATAVAGANCDVTYAGDVVGYWRFGPGCFSGYDTADLVARGEAAVAADILADGVEYARAHEDQVPGVVLARVQRVWGVWDVDEQASLAALDEGKSAAWVRVGTWVGWGAGLVAFVGLVVAIRRRMWALVVATVAPLLAVTAAAALTYGNARFRAGAEPALAVLAASVVARAGRSR